MSTYLDAIRERVVIFDGATGTNLQLLALDAEDFGGAHFEGCNEVLVDTRPDVVANLHRSFLDVGVDAIETDSFGSFAVPLGEYGIAERAQELSFKAARIAREVADDYASPGSPRWVAGSMGPGTKMPTLGQIGFDALRDAYELQVRGLIDGGVDLLLIETQFDLLAVKAAMIGARRAMRAVGRDVPLQVQVTIELTGRMLPGTEIGAALTAIDAMRPDVIGLNCATGPDEMAEHLRYLARHSRVPVACMPNAGLPSVVEGKMRYDLTPDGLAEHLERFVSELGVSVIGGCCGTTPDHLRAVVARCRDLQPAPRQIDHEAECASLYASVPFSQQTSFLVIGERTNANGSRQFRDMMSAADWDGCIAVAREQIREGAHVLDVCVDYVGRDGRADMDQLASRLATQAAAPLMLDSTEPAVMEAGLRHLGGKPILNSANLEEGDAPGSRFDRVLGLAREYGAAVVCLLIDEQGQARDVEWKLRVAHRIYDLALRRYGMDPGDLLIDALTFPLSTGDEALRADAVATIEAIRRIKAELPGASTVLGVSNVSFGLKPAARHALNSVFLHECVKAGLDAAIVHAGRIVPLGRIPERTREVCLDLIYDRRPEGGDPLAELLEIFTDVSHEAPAREDISDLPIERRLERRIVDGEKEAISGDLDEALAAGIPALDIINELLLPAMKTVGDLFASGEMQLPFVLQSAETMKRAVSRLEPHMEKADQGGRGRIVLATVKGDVHDIGKNLVDIILTNNGYEVFNLGTKVPVGEMADKAIEVDADAIGMSGLLVKSTLAMRENLEELNRRGLAHIPVLLGGAALTRSYVERDLREVYEGRVFYGKNAFEGLHTMDRLMDYKREGTLDAHPEFGTEATGRLLPPRHVETSDVVAPERSPVVETDNPVFVPPFVGTRVVTDLDLDEIAQLLNETALFRNQWQFRPDKETDEEFKARMRPLLQAELSRAKSARILEPRVVYGYFAANGDGDELIVWEDEARTAERTRFRFPRQTVEPWLCIADFFRPVQSGDVDYAAFQVVTMGPRVSEETARLFADNRYRDYLLLHGLGVEMAEALAEHWHRHLRREWGFGQEDAQTVNGLFRQQYRGGRYSWGYPACPDLEDNAKVVGLLAADRIGVEVTDNYMLHPEQSTLAMVCHHPKAKYFLAR